MQLGSKILLLATLATKHEEVAFLRKCLSDHGVTSEIIDISLDTEGAVLDGQGKMQAMEDAVAHAIGAMDAKMDDTVHGVLGIGGGTGGEIILRALRALPITFPKLLITTLPFDPRIAVADNSIVLVPTLADLSGLNATLREVLENAAAMTAGLATTRRKAGACVQETSVGITALGATEGAIAPLVGHIRSQGQEATVFHANGYGGAAYARFIRRGAFHTLIDLTPHELTRMMLAGAHVPMPDRFSAGADLPRIVLPGALNFIGLGERRLVPPAYLDRPHYSHSGYFTHVKLTQDEMARVATKLIADLNAATGPRHLIVPMGGFSHQDRPGGAIEDPGLRMVFLEHARGSLAPDVGLTVIDAHISAPEVTEAIAGVLGSFASSEKDVTHV